MTFFSICPQSGIYVKGISVVKFVDTNHKEYFIASISVTQKYFLLVICVIAVR